MSRSHALALLAACGWIAIIWLWDAAFLALTVDDSFYYFGIARNVAAGSGLTLAGVESTSGFHPLWLLVLVPFGPLLRASPDMAVRVILTLQVGLVALGCMFLGRTRAGAEGRAAAVFAVCSLVFSFTKVFVNGLESALELVFLAWVLAMAERAVEKAEPRAVIAVGALGGVLTIARLNAIVCAVVLLALVVRRTRPRLRVTVTAAAAMLAPALAYALFLQLRFGHPMPVSAAIKYGKAFFAWRHAALPILVSISVLAFAVREELRTARWPIWALPLLAWIGVQLSLDPLLRYMIVPEIWYLVPHATLFVLAASAAIERQPRLRLGGVAVAIAAIFVWTARVRFVTYSFYAEARTVGGWLAENTPADARIAGWDCGIEAFYSKRTFLNLDGLASSWEYKTEYLDKHRTREYLTARDVRYVAQYVSEGDARTHFHGVVDLSDWEVVLDRPYEFRGIIGTIGQPTRRFHFLVLKRP